jgi:hypothetical protein
MAAAASRFNPQPQQSYKPKSQIEAVKAPFTGTSTHHLDYRDFNPELYSAPKESFKPKRSASAASSAPFTGGSTHHDTFVPHAGASPTLSCRPDASASQLRHPPTASTRLCNSASVSFSVRMYAAVLSLTIISFPKKKLTSKLSMPLNAHNMYHMRCCLIPNVGMFSLLFWVSHGGGSSTTTTTYIHHHWQPQKFKLDSQ